MNKSIRWLLTEAKVSNLDPKQVNFIDGKLICYHLTSMDSWLKYNSLAKRMSSQGVSADKEILPTDNRSQRIVKKITNLAKNKKDWETWEIEETVIEDMIDDPYTDTSGFKPGGGDYHGKGLYTCYKFNPQIARTYGDICLVFEIDISNFLITFEDLAKQVHGENWTIKDQLIKFYMREEKSQESLNKFKKLLEEIPDKDLTMSKSISDNERNAGISLALMSMFTKELIPSLYDGIILFGSSDGPVCVSFYPKYDAKMIGLGRLNVNSYSSVDWYDSLNDFLGGKARLKQDFETINAIAEENMDPEEKESMKRNDMLPFDVQFIKITNFFKSISSGYWSQKEDLYNEIFDIYVQVKDEDNQRMSEFFLDTFLKSNINFELFSRFNERFVQLINDLAAYCQNKNVSLLRFSINLIDACVEKQTPLPEFFLKSCIDLNMQTKNLTTDNSRVLVEFFTSIVNRYRESVGLSQEIEDLLNSKNEQFGVDLVVSSGNMLKILKFYKKTSDINKSKIIDQVADLIENTRRISFDYLKNNHDLINDVLDELLGKIIIKKRNSKSFKTSLLESICISLFNRNSSYKFNDQINYYLAHIFIENFDFLADGKSPILGSTGFTNLYFYLSKVLPETHPLMIEIENKNNEIVQLTKNEVDKFLNRLDQSLVTKNELSKNIENHRRETEYISYLSQRSKEWFTKYVKLIIKNASLNTSFKNIKPADANYILNVAISQDVILTKAEQFEFTRKFAKTDYYSKNDFAKYKYADPDVFIELLEPDMKKGGMGAGLSFKGFEYSLGVYELLYKSRKVVDLFGRSAKPGLLLSIIKNITQALLGKYSDTMANGKLIRTGFSRNAPFMNYATEEAEIGDVINLNDFDWLEYFLAVVKSNPGRGFKKPVKLLEDAINIRKSNTQNTNQQVDQDIDEPKLDLSHRKLFGNTLKEIYNF